MSQNEYDNIPEEIKKFLPDFIAETEENLRILNEKLLATEEAYKKGEAISADNLNSLFRAAHSIKGTASFVGLKKIVDLTHKLETILQKLRDQDLEVAPPLFDALFVAFDLLTKMLKKLRKGQDDKVDIGPVVADIDQILSTVKHEPEGAELAEEPAGNAQDKQVPVSAKEGVGPESVLSEESLLGSCDQLLCRLQELLDSLKTEKADSGVPREPLLQILQQIYRVAVFLSSSPLQELTQKIFVIIYSRPQTSPEASPFPLELIFKSLGAFRLILDSMKSKSQLNKDDLKQICGKLQAYIKQNVKQDLDVNITQWSPGASPDTAEPFEDFMQLKNLNVSEKNALFDALDQGYDLFKIMSVIAQDIPEKVIKVVLIEERLKKCGVVISVKTSAKKIEGISREIEVGAFLCSVENETNIRKALMIDGVKVNSVERQGPAELKDFLDQYAADHAEIFGEKAEDPAVHMDSEGALLPEKAPDFPRRGGDHDISILKIDSRKIDKLMILSGELVTIRAQFSRLGALLKTAIRQGDNLNSVVNNFSASLLNLQKGMTNIIEIESIDKRIEGGLELAKLITSLNESLSNIKRDTSVKETAENVNFLDETTSQLEKVASEIQSSVMNARMVPVEGVFNRFKRIIRDIAKEVQKDVVLELEGEETELDKKIVDALVEPLTHMIRNAIDHGIEDKGTRVQQGKPESGAIQLKASHLGNSICIEMVDDGRGIDLNKVIKTATKKGLINQAKLETMTEQEKYGLIFLPGFSTSEQITGLSGRGVGMDSVKNMINSLNGMIDIKSEPGQGTTFVIKIPLTLAIIQALLVKIGDYTFAFPVETVVEIIKVNISDIYLIDGNPIVKLREHALSLVELKNVIYVQGKDRSNYSYYNVVIISDGINRVGVVVDELIAKEEIVIKSLPNHFVNVQGVAGAAILADGSISLILDIHTIIHSTM